MLIPYQRILVPLDGSELAAQALPHAEEIARRFDARLILSRIVETTAEFAVAPIGTEANSGKVGVGVLMGTGNDPRYELDEAKEYLERLAASLQHRKIDTEVDINIGNPAARIVDYAAANAVDLIVMSTHGQTGVGRWTFGSITNKVLQTAPCAVLVVRPMESRK